MNELKGLQAQGQQLVEFASTPLDTPQRLYLAGFVLIAFGLIQTWVTGTAWTVIWVAGLGAICIGFIQEVGSKIKALWALSLMPKVAAVLWSAVIAFPSYLLAHQSVNSITGIAPEAFPFSVPVLASFYALLVVPMTGAFILGIYSLWTVLVLTGYGIRAQFGTIPGLFFKPKRPINPNSIVWHGSRLIAAITLMSVLLHFTGLYEQAEETTLKQIRTEIIVAVDYYPRSPCRNVAAQERVAFLKDGKISVATRKTGGWDFRYVSCEAT